MKSSEEIKESFQKMKLLHGINLIDKVLELRKYEIDNLWKRVLFFWGTIALLLAAYFKAGLPDNYLIFISFIGLIYNIIFSLSIRGSKYWQEHWESMARAYERVIGYKLFIYSTSKRINLNNKSVLTKPYRFSVSKLTMLLSDITALVWLMVWIKDIFMSYTHKTLHFEFSIKNGEIDIYTLSVVLFHIIIIGYISIFFWRGKVYHKFPKQRKKKSVHDEPAADNVGE